MTGLRIGSMFSGAGGLDLAALELFPGASMAWHAEIDPAASKVLAHHWPTVPNLGDVAGIDWGSVEPVDILTGGFPCQDVSLAGRRAGLADGTRSGLWSHMFAAVAALRPRFVLIENVRGLLSAKAVRGMESGNGTVGDDGDGPVLRALGAVLGDLSSIGFDAEWTCIRASDVGACHQRARVFILAYPAHADDSRLEGAESTWRHDMPSRGFGCYGRDGRGSGVRLLPTPQVADATGGHKTRSGARSEELLLPGVVEAYTTGSFLPTPRATDGTKGGPNQRGSSGDLMLPSAVAQLLPTPRTTDSHGAGMHGSGGMDLRTAVAMWGPYEAAILRQELLSRPAPAPTELTSWLRMVRRRREGRDRRPVGMRGSLSKRPQLAAEFAEWMMWWPAGWVTAPEIGLTRNEQLKAIGNGVVPRQAVVAFNGLLVQVGELSAAY